MKFCFKKELIELSKEACKKLDSLERQVIERLFLGEEQLMDIAHSLGYSRCHISRVKKKALEALQLEMQNSLNLKSEKREPGRRTVHRRRPRSEKAKQARRNKLTLPEKIAATG